MICSNCNTTNDNTAQYCRVCGSPLKASASNKKWSFFNVLFWISFPVFCYSLISVVFPLESQRYFPGYGGNEGSYHTYYSDLLGLNSDGVNYYMEEWMPVVIISAVIAGLSYYVKKKTKSI